MSEPDMGRMEACVECEELHEQHRAHPNWCCHCPCHLADARLRAVVDGDEDLAGARDA